MSSRLGWALAWIVAVPGLVVPPAVNARPARTVGNATTAPTEAARQWLRRYCRPGSGGAALAGVWCARLESLSRTLPWAVRCLTAPQTAAVRPDPRCQRLFRGGAPRRNLAAFPRLGPIPGARARARATPEGPRLTPPRFATRGSQRAASTRARLRRQWAAVRLKRASQLLARAKAERALALCRGILRRVSDHLPTHLLLAEIQLRLGDAGAALRTLSRVRRLDPRAAHRLETRLTQRSPKRHRRPARRPAVENRPRL